LTKDTTIHIILVLSIYYVSLKPCWVAKLIHAQVGCPGNIHQKYSQNNEGLEFGDSTMNLLRTKYKSFQSPSLWMATFQAFD
jgi:hypothetical protein